MDEDCVSAIRLLRNDIDSYLKSDAHDGEPQLSAAGEDSEQINADIWSTLTEAYGEEISTSFGKQCGCCPMIGEHNLIWQLAGCVCSNCRKNQGQLVFLTNMLPFVSFNPSESDTMHMGAGMYVFPFLHLVNVIGMSDAEAMTKEICRPLVKDQQQTSKVAVCIDCLRRGRIDLKYDCKPQLSTRDAGQRDTQLSSFETLTDDKGYVVDALLNSTNDRALDPEQYQKQTWKDAFRSLPGAGAYTRMYDSLIDDPSFQDLYAHCLIARRIVSLVDDSTRREVNMKVGTFCAALARETDSLRALCAVEFAVTMVDLAHSGVSMHMQTLLADEVNQIKRSATVIPNRKDETGCVLRRVDSALQGAQEHIRRAAMSERTMFRMPQRYITDIPLTFQTEMDSYIDTFMVQIPKLSVQQNRLTAPLGLPHTATSVIVPNVVYAQTRDTVTSTLTLLEALHHEYARISTELGLSLLEYGALSCEELSRKLASSQDMLQMIAASVRVCNPLSPFVKRFAAHLDAEFESIVRARNSTPILHCSATSSMVEVITNLIQSGIQGEQHSTALRTSTVHLTSDIFRQYIQKRRDINPAVSLGIEMTPDEYEIYKSCAVLNAAQAAIRSWVSSDVTDYITRCAAKARSAEIPAIASGGSAAKPLSQIVHICVESMKGAGTEVSRFNRMIEAVIACELFRLDNIALVDAVSLKLSEKGIAAGLIEQLKHEPESLLPTGAHATCISERVYDARGAAPSVKVANDRALCGPSCGTGAWRIKNGAFVSVARSYGDGTIFCRASYDIHSNGYTLYDHVFPRDFSGESSYMRISDYAVAREDTLRERVATSIELPHTASSSAVIPSPFVPERCAEIHFNGVAMCDGVSVGPKFVEQTVYDSRKHHIIHRVMSQKSDRPLDAEVRTSAAKLASSTSQVLAHTLPPGYAVQTQRNEYGTTLSEFSTPLLQVDSDSTSPVPRALPAIMSCSFEPPCEIALCCSMPLYGHSTTSGLFPYVQMFDDAELAIRSMLYSSNDTSSVYACEATRIRPRNPNTTAILAAQCVVDNLRIATNCTKGFSGIMTFQELCSLCESIPRGAISRNTLRNIDSLRTQCRAIIEVVARCVPPYSEMPIRELHRHKVKLLEAAAQEAEAVARGLSHSVPVDVNRIRASFIMNRIQISLGEARACTKMVINCDDRQQCEAALSLCGHLAMLVNQVQSTVLSLSAVQQSAVTDAVCESLRKASMSCKEILRFPGSKQARDESASANDVYTCQVRSPRYVCDRVYWVAHDYMTRVSPKMFHVSAITNALLQFDTEQLTLLVNNHKQTKLRLEDVVALVAYEVYLLGDEHVPIQTSASDQARSTHVYLIPAPVSFQFLWNITEKDGFVPANIMSVDEQVKTNRQFIIMPRETVSEIIGDAASISASEWLAIISAYMCHVDNLSGKRFYVDPAIIETDASSTDAFTSQQTLRSAFDMAYRLVRRAFGRPDLTSLPAEINTYALSLCPGTLEPTLTTRRLYEQLQERGQEEADNVPELGEPSRSPETARATYAAADRIQKIRQVQGACISDELLRQYATVSASVAQVNYSDVTTLIRGAINPKFTQGMVSDENTDCSFYIAYAVRADFRQVAPLSHDVDVTNVLRSAFAGMVHNLISDPLESRWNVLLPLHRIALEAWYDMVIEKRAGRSLLQSLFGSASDREIVNIPGFLDSVVQWNESRYAEAITPLLDKITSISDADMRYSLIERYSAMMAYNVSVFVDDTLTSHRAYQSGKALSILSSLLIAGVATDVLISSYTSSERYIKNSPIMLEGRSSSHSAAAGVYQLPVLCPELLCAIFSIPSAAWPDVCMQLVTLFMSPPFSSFSYIMGRSNTRMQHIQQAASQVNMMLKTPTRRTMSESGMLRSHMSPILGIVYFRLIATEMSSDYEHKSTDLAFCRTAWEAVSKYLRQ